MRTTELHEHPASSLVPDMRLDEWRAFFDDVVQRGIVVPLDVLPDGTILDGRHRYKAALELGLAEVPTRVVTPEDPEAYMIQAAVLRRHLTDDQRAVLALRWQRRASPGSGYRSDLQPLADVSKGSINTRAEAAQVFGISERKVRYAKSLSDAAPDLLESVADGDIPMVKAIQEAARRQRPAPAISSPLPGGKYRCIVIDPPWPMQKLEREERPWQGRSLDYPIMSLDEIYSLPIPDLADPAGCHVYLWVTQKYLPAGLELFEAWGVRYQCLLTWVKPTGITPYSWMYNTEHVLFGRIGNLQLTRLGLKLSFDAPVTRHSEKPAVFFERVIAASPGPRLEMFARQPRDGFDAWGNEVGTKLETR